MKTITFKDSELMEFNAILEREEKRLTKIRLENLQNDSIYNYTSRELNRIERLKNILNGWNNDFIVNFGGCSSWHKRKF